MKALQLKEFINYFKCDWAENKVLVLSEDVTKLEKLAKDLTEESLLFIEQSKKIRYSKELELTDKKRHEEIAKLHSTFEHISKYGIYCEIDGYENILKIIDIEVI